MRPSHVPAAALAVAIVLGCNGVTGAENRCQFLVGPTHVLVTPPPLPDSAGAGRYVLARGKALQLHVNARSVVDASPGALGGCSIIYGDPIVSEIEWRSTNPAVATVDASGKVTAIAAGRDTVVARIIDIDRSARLPFIVTP